MRQRWYRMVFIGISFFVLFSAKSYGDTFYGEVKAVNSGERTVQFSPRTAEGIQPEMTLKVSPAAVLTGVDSFTELEAGDSIRVEVQNTARGQEVQRLDLEEPYGLDPEGKYTWSGKLGRGVVNFFTSPVEIPRLIDHVGRRSGPGQGWTVGLVQGAARMFVRAGAGILETVTFPFNFPDENKAPIFLPEYAWQEWEQY